MVALGTDRPAATDGACLVSLVEVVVVVMGFPACRLLVPDGPSHESPRTIPPRHDDAASGSTRAKRRDIC